MAIRWRVGIILSLFSLTNALEISKDGSGYNGIYVGIHNDVPESLELLEKIKSTFTSASEFLFNATSRRAYFKTVTIVIPPSWNETLADNTVYKDYYDESHVRIAEGNPEYGDAPYTLQPGGCGEQGIYIHLTPKFVLDEFGWASENYGDTSRQLVHEWAHLRYGVFDEYGIQNHTRFPLFYQMDGRIYPTACVKDVQGWIERSNGEPCLVYKGKVSNDCLFIPDLSIQDNKASIMFMPYLPKLEGFCEDSTPQKEHNRRSPSMQNAFCDLKSTWEVIRSNDDFKGSKGNPDLVTKFNETKPTIRIVRKAEGENRRTVLVMDISSSMVTSGGGQRLKNLQAAALSLISNTMPENSSLGMVTFTTSAKTVAPMTKITSQNVRNQLIAQIPKNAGGGTNIASGLMEALRVLRANGQSSEGGIIILISDGEDGSDKQVKTLVDAKVIVNAIAQGPQASGTLEGVTVATGGKFFYVADSSNVANDQLEAAFYESFTVQANVEVQPVTVANDKIQLTSNQNVTQNFNVEKELGKNTVVSITGPSQLDRVEVTLTSPNGTKFNKLNRPDGFSESAGKMQFNFKNAEIGSWTITFKSPSNMEVTLKMTSEALDPKDQPIRARSWFGSIEVTYPAVAKVYAQVSKGYNAVIRANVVAYIGRPVPNEKPIELILHDNGIGADVQKDDGIYTAYFSQFAGDGRYSTVVEVINDGHARIKAGIPGSGAPVKIKRKSTNNDPPRDAFEMDQFFSVDEEPEEVEVPSEPAQSFTRNSNAGSFQLKGKPAGTVDRIPPSKISDLVAQSDSSEIGTGINVTLTWTAPGDDMDYGTVTSYEIRTANESDALYPETDTDIRHLFEDLNITPLLAGSVQSVNVTLPDSVFGNGTTADVYFSVRALDKARNRSPLSNLASLHFGYNAPPPKEVTTEGNMIENAEQSEFPLVAVIVGSVVGAIVIVAAVIAVIKCRKRTKNISV